MGWGTFGIFLTYLLKSAMRALHYFESSNWERTTALITGQIVQAPIWGCSSVKLHYHFGSEGHAIKGYDVIPFPTPPEAKAYAESFPHNLPRIIRVNPKNPEKTRYFDRDQKG